MFRQKHIAVIWSALLILNSAVYCQNAVWYFGQKAGIRFASNIPIALLNSEMNAPEGCATAYDASGNLLFYSNGLRIWNKNHQLMMNGDNLMGSALAAQGVAIVRTEDPAIFYLITADEKGGQKGLRYSKIEINGSIPNGRVVSGEKNILLHPNVTEKICIIRHCNKKDAWIVAHGWGNNEFYAWKATKYGISPAPVVSAVGSVHSGNISNTAGYMKYDDEQFRLAVAVMGDGFVEMFDFNNTTGQVSNPLMIDNIPQAYGLEFDFAGFYLYVSSASGYLYQFRLAPYTVNDIQNSKTLIHSSNSLIGALQRGPDFRIYIAQDLSLYLGIIKQPSAPGLQCNVDPMGIYLGGRKSEAGLPGMLNKVTVPYLTKNYPCIGDTAWFKIMNLQYPADSVLWTFGDTATAPDDTCTALNGWHIYKYEGIYKVNVIIWGCGTTDTLRTTIAILGPPKIDLGPDRSFCKNQPCILSASGGTQYLWHDSTTLSYYTVSDTGWCWVIVSNLCGSDQDSVHIDNIWPVPTVDLGNDTLICQGNSIMLNAGAGYHYQWQNMDTTQYIIVTYSDIYSVTVTNEFNCTAFDSKKVDVLAPPEVNLGQDTSLCVGKFLTLNSGDYPNIQWSTGSTQQQQLIAEGGIYYVTVSNQCGIATDTIHILKDECEKIIWIPSAFTPNKDGVNDVFRVVGVNVSDFELYIINRWGEVFYHSTDINEGWNGTYQGKACPIGVYAWKLRYSDFNGRKYYEVGTLTLIR